jgi:DNA repair exonuclease SbcCD ATPase subunit
MNPHDQPCQATPAGDLRQQIMDSRVPKNEREWWAGREIEKLERELATAKAERERFRLCTLKQDGEISRLRAELAIAENWVEHHSQHADDLIADNTRLRDEVERLKQVSGGLESELETEKTTRNYLLEKGAKLERAAEKAEADNAKWQKLLLMSRDDREIDLISEVEEQARLLGMSAEREADLLGKLERLAKDKERLDWLAVSDTWFDCPATDSFNPETFRDAIDAAMKGTP